jgi:hypothetical protein
VIFVASIIFWCAEHHQRWPLIKPTKAIANPDRPPARNAQRTQPRIPVSLPVVVEHSAGILHALTVNVGPGGMFIQADAVLAYAVRVELLVQLPGIQEPSHLPGVVRWSDNSGFGVQFLQLGARETHALATLVASARG